MAKNVVLQHSPKQLEIIELKLEINNEEERKSKPKHDMIRGNGGNVDRDVARQGRGWTAYSHASLSSEWQTRAIHLVNFNFGPLNFFFSIIWRVWHNLS